MFKSTEIKEKMDNTTSGDTVSESSSLLTAVLGIVTFIENGLLLILISKVIWRMYKSKQPRDIIIQLFFVCLNDMISALFFCMVGLLKVSSITAAYVCAYTILTSVSTQNVSHGNIVCICIQRYICARNIRKRGSVRQLPVSKVLLPVNIIIGGVSLICTIATANVKHLNMNVNYVCSINAVVANAMGVSVLFYVISIILILLSDVLCAMTIYKLRTEIPTAVFPESTVSHIQSTSQPAGPAGQSIKLRQQKAIGTLFLILLFCNLSVLPMITVHTFNLLNLLLSDTLKRIAFICLYLNSVVNPVIIALRTQDIRRSLQVCFESAKQGCLWRF